MNPDAVMASTAGRLRVSLAPGWSFPAAAPKLTRLPQKTGVQVGAIRPTSSDAAVKQAIAETSIIQEAKEYFTANGVDLDALKSPHRSGTSILVKNFPFPTSAEELRQLFAEHALFFRSSCRPREQSPLSSSPRRLLPRTALAKLAYRRFRDSVLKLEPGPKNLFVSPQQQQAAQEKLDQRAPGKCT